MELLLGQAISGRDLEEITSRWDPRRFASMCNSLIWIASGRRSLTFPSFTDQINAPDGGIDAEWNIEISADSGYISDPFFSPGWNVFQYKKRDIIVRGRSRIVSELKAKLRGALADVSQRSHKIPTRYVLFLNVDLQAKQKASLKESIIEDSEDSSKSHVEIIAAGELAALLNDNPHLRAAYFAPLSFKTWEDAYQAHRAQKLFGSSVDLIGRAKEIEKLRALIKDVGVRVILIVGPHDIGKTRLALEATGDQPYEVVTALNPRSMDLSDYRNLSRNRDETLCIVEDPDPEHIDALALEVLSIPNLKLVMTVPTSTWEPAISYGRDKRIETLRLGPLDDNASRELLRATGNVLDYSLEEWIVRQAQGIPGIILAAADAGTTLRQGAEGFLSQVGGEFERRIQDHFGDDVRKGAELFSILTHVGISGAYSHEVHHICELFGDGYQVRELMLTLEKLESAGLVRRGKPFAEIILPIVAGHLAKRLIAGQVEKVFALFGRLEESGRIRLLRRLADLEGPEVDRFWREFFDSTGPLGNFDAALRQPHIIHLVSGAVPAGTLHLLEAGLAGKTMEERLAIAGKTRRELMWALEQLLFRQETSRGALRLIWLLAEAENEAIGNNATGVLSECFFPFHDQLPLPLDERIEALKEFTSRAVSQEGRIVAIKAAGEGIKENMFMLRQGVGKSVLGSRPRFTYDEVFNYFRELLDMLIGLGEDDDRNVAQAALTALPECIVECAYEGRPADAITRLGMVVDWALRRKEGLDVASVSHSIALLRESFVERRNKPDLDEAKKQELEKYLGQLKSLAKRLECGDFFVRLRRWAGRWTLDDEEDLNQQIRPASRCTAELRKLAEETVRAPELLSADAQEWLLSTSAEKAYLFFHELGSKDTGGALRNMIEEIGKKPEGRIAFSYYWGGWARQDYLTAEHQLEELAKGEMIPGHTIIQAISQLRATEALLETVKDQIARSRIDPSLAGRILMGSWSNDLSQYLELLELVAGKNYENSATAIYMIVMSQPHPTGALAEFAWRCLESDPSLDQPVKPWHLDELAAKLAQDNAEKGFHLLRQLLLRGDIPKRWDPISRFFGKPRFWNVLYNKDRNRLLGLVIEVCRTSPRKRFRVTWRMRELLNQEVDKDLLIGFAKKDEETAEIVSEIITSAKPGFWLIAYELWTLYPNNSRIDENIANGIKQEGTIIEGTFSQSSAERKVEVERQINDPNTPPVPRMRLRKIADRLERQLSHDVVWEYDEDINNLREYIDDKDSPERVWAIGRVLKYGEPGDWRTLLSVDDIQEALPLVDLPEKKRRAIEIALRVWRGEI